MPDPTASPSDNNTAGASSYTPANPTPPPPSGSLNTADITSIVSAVLLATQQAQAQQPPAVQTQQVATLPHFTGLPSISPAAGKLTVQDLFPEVEGFRQVDRRLGPGAIERGTVDASAGYGEMGSLAPMGEPVMFADLRPVPFNDKDGRLTLNPEPSRAGRREKSESWTFRTHKSDCEPLSTISK
ncbi:hypothetical protein FRB90_008526 [Tulasnella sp. 427]|nr:hypothetical protein FRB90_008526 [Tulasnella sp. 427]